MNCPSFVEFCKFIPDAPDGQNIARLGGVCFDLGPQTIDVGINRVFVTVMPVSPHLIQQLRTRKNPPGVSRKIQQQIEFFGGQIDTPVTQTHRASLGVDDQICGPDERLIVLAGDLIAAHRCGEKWP